MAEETTIKEKSEKWDKYQESLRRARKNYLADKKTVTAVIRLSEYEEVRSYCELRGCSIQELIKEALMEKVRKNSEK